MVEAAEALTTEKSINLFEKFGIYTRTELASRQEITYETYSKYINIEAKTMIDMASKQYIPAVIGFTKNLADTVVALNNIGADSNVQKKLLSDVSGKLTEATDALNALGDVVAKVEKLATEKEKAFAFKDEVKPAMDKLRAPIDALEMMVDEKLWPVPTYDELIFEV